MATHVLPPDEELVLTGYIRDRLIGTQWDTALVSNRLTRRGNGDEVEPAEDYAVIVRSDGGPRGEPPTFARRFGIRVFGPDGDGNGTLTGALARYVAASLPAAPKTQTPIAALNHLSGPYRVPETVGRPEAYITCEFVLVGQPITFQERT